MKSGFIGVVKAEAIKQHKCQFHSMAIYFSMLLWPVLELLIAYYTYKPFLDLEGTSPIARWISREKVAIFIIIGYIVYMFFTSLVDSAWGFTSERLNGTLDLIYLTPANLFSVMVGNTISSLVANTWMFFIFSFGSAIIFSCINISSFYMIFISVIVLIIPSVCWGIFMNGIFLFTRDVRVLYTLIKAPMDTFSGVKVPFKAFPFWAKIIGIVFPLTWSLNVIRKIYIDAATLQDIKYDLLIIFLICAILVFISMLIIKKAEYHARKTGNNTLF